MSNSLAKSKEISPAEVKEAFGDYTGTNYPVNNKSYPYIVILQSDKTYDAFADGDNITRKLHGKMFIRSANKNHIKDLRDVIQGVIIKEQRGAELWSENNFLWSKGNDFAFAEEKQSVADKFGVNIREVKNVIKLLIKLASPLELENGEVYEFAVITIKGASFMPYNDQVKDKQKELIQTDPQLKDLGYNTVDQVPVVFWFLTIRSKLINDTTNKRDYYVYDMDVQTIPVEKAMNLKDTMVEAGNYDLISMRSVGSEAPAVQGEPVVEKRAEESVEATEVIEDEDPVAEEEINGNEETIIDPDDLPF